MNFKNIFAIATLLFVTACASTPQKYPSVGYLAVNLPQGKINTSSNQVTTTDTSSRNSIGVYRPPVEFTSLLDSSKVHRDVDVVLQTPMCVFPIICLGTDKVIKVAEGDKLKK